MKIGIQFIIGLILFCGTNTNLFAVQTAINAKKEPKIIFDDIIKPTETQQTKVQTKEQIVEKKEEIKVKQEEKTLPLIDTNKNTVTQDLQKDLYDYTNEDHEKKENILLLKKEKKEILAEEPKQLALDKKTKKFTKDEPIALVYASGTIGKYAIESSNVAMTYLVNKNSKFKLEVFDIEKESKESILQVLDLLSEKKIKKVIFLFTTNSIWILNSYQNIAQFQIYLPLISKSAVTYPKPNYIFGGMDYGQQFQYFKSIAKKDIVEIYDESGISKTLHEELVKLDIPNIKYVELKGSNPNYNPLIVKSNKVKNSTVILNTSIVRSAIVLALLRGHDVDPIEVFATQLNYSPLIFNLTQEEDRNNLYIANSVELLPRDLEELISFFGDDVLFSWVNYSTILGLEYFMTNNKKLFGNIEIKENQVKYPVRLYRFEGTKIVETKR